MQSLDDKTYKKYFARRLLKSKWSVKNKELVKISNGQRFNDPARVRSHRKREGKRFMG